MAYKGMYLKKIVPTDIKEGSWWEEQCVVRQGGYDLDQSNLPAELKWLPKGTVVKLGTGGKAVAVKTAKVTEKAEAATKTVKLAPGSLFKEGDTIGGKKISSIARSATLDTVTLSAGLEAAINADDIVTDYNKDSDVLLGFTYATKELDKDASQQVEPTLRVMEVEEVSLPYPINADIKAGLNVNGIALFKIQ